MADETLVVVVLDVLQGALGQRIAVGRRQVRITEQPQAQAEACQVAMVALRHTLGRAQGFILPGTVAVGLLQDFHRAFQLLGALDLVVRPPGRRSAASGRRRCAGTSR